MPFPWMAAAAIGSGILGAVGQSNQNRANSAQALRQMEFQERMSNTAHQREVTDLEKAGLNPILSAGGSGASSPGGAQATMGNVEGAGIGAAVQSAQAYAGVKNMQMQNKLIGEQVKGETLNNISKAPEAILKGAGVEGGRRILIDAGMSPEMADKLLKKFDDMDLWSAKSTKQSFSKKWFKNVDHGMTKDVRKARDHAKYKNYGTYANWDK